MKRKVYVKIKSSTARIYEKENGDCFDLVACEDITVFPEQPTRIKLGVAMAMPSGIIAKMHDRSSTPSRYRIHLANSMGFIDNSFRGNGDEWRYEALAISSDSKTPVQIKKGDRICQFDFCLSQKATVMDKLKWLFTSGYEFIYTSDLGNENRGGFGAGTPEPR